jgi:hypothetical protein
MKVEVVAVSVSGDGVTFLSAAACYVNVRDLVYAAAAARRRPSPATGHEEP